MLDASIVGLYILSTICVGIYFSRNIKSIREFSLSNRKFPGPVILATVSATFIGAEYIFGFAEQSYRVGFLFFFPLIGWCLCKLIIATFIVPRMARFGDAISVGDIMAKDYGQIGRVTTGVCAAILSIGFVGAQIAACGALFEYFFDIPSVFGVYLGCAIVVVYSALGGFRAVAFTDFLQFAVLVVVIPLIGNFELSKLGGLSELFAKLPQSHVTLSFDKILEQCAWFFIFLIPLLDPAILQRTLMDRDHKKISRAFKISALIDVPLYLLVCIIGLIALVTNPGLDANMAFPHILQGLPKGILGLALIGVLAVIMSTADSFLNVASISMVHDVLKPLFLKKITEKQELRLAQVSTVFLGASAIIGALSFPRILDLIIYFQNISWMPLIMVPLYATIFGLRADVRSFLVAGFFGISIQFAIPMVFGPIPELALALIILLASFLGLIISHRVFSKNTPVVPPPLPRAFKPKTSFLKSIRFFSYNRVKAFGASYSLFGLFAVLNYMIPVFMWSDSKNVHFSQHLVFRLVAAILCFALMMHEYWPVKLRKWLPIYWHATLLYCLPFFATYMLLDNGFTNLWVCNVVLALFLLASLVDGISFVVLLLLGAVFGSSCFYLLEGDFSKLVLDNETLYSTLYLFSFVVMIGILFSRRKERITDEKFNAVKTVSASIAHEIRTPLSTIAVAAQNLSLHLPCYEQAYDLAEQANLPITKLRSHEREGIKEIPRRIEEICENTQNLINMLLVKTNSRPPKNLDICSINDCVDQALLNYPLSKNNRVTVTWKKDVDFMFLGNKLLFVHVLFNLIQNSLDALFSMENAEIIIWTEQNSYENTLHFKDNGCGIPKQILPNLFERFNSGSEYGSGVGLAYCKMVMKSFGGEIMHLSDNGYGSELVMSFPKLKNS